MLIYHHHPVTGVYLGASEARPAPLELEQAREAVRGPMIAAAREAFDLVGAGPDAAPGALAAAEDAYRQAVEAAERAALAVEPSEWLLPAHATFTPPPSPAEGEAVRWSADGWVTETPADAAEPTPRPDHPFADPDPAAAARRDRDHRIARTRWLIERHADEIALGAEPSLSSADHLAVLAYVQALRDVPAQSGFPADITWPEPPAGFGL